MLQRISVSFDQFNASFTLKNTGSKTTQFC